MYSIHDQYLRAFIEQHQQTLVISVAFIILFIVLFIIMLYIFYNAWRSQQLNIEDSVCFTHQ